MKKRNLLIAAILSCMSTLGVMAQVTTVLNPTLNAGNGYVLHAEVLGGFTNINQVWTETDDLADEAVLGYTRTGTHKSLMGRAWATGKYISKNDCYVIISGADLSAYSSSTLMLSYMQKGIAAVGRDFTGRAAANASVFEVYVSDNYQGDYASTTWTKVQTGTATGAWESKSLDLSAYSSSSNFAIAFRLYQIDVRVSPTVTNNPGDWYVSDVRITADQATAIEGTFVSEVVYFMPNPVENTLNFDAFVKRAVIYNVNGSKALEVKNTNGSANVSMLPAGIYMIQLVLENGTTVTKKLVKK